MYISTYLYIYDPREQKTRIIFQITLMCIVIARTITGAAHRKPVKLLKSHTIQKIKTCLFILLYATCFSKCTFFRPRQI